MLQLRHKTSEKGPLWLVDQKYSLGSSNTCEIHASGPDIKALHGELLVNGDSVELVNSVGGTALKVNGESITDRALLKAGDIIDLGGEQFELFDPKSTTEEETPKTSTTQGWALKALNTALADKHFPLAANQVLGRSQECDISLGVVHLSRKHAKITVTERGLQVQDLNSSNGTYINGKKIGAVTTAIAGDEISFDTLRFRVIGPVIDEDKTTLRPSSDGDLTTIRPALNMGQTPQQQAAAKSAPAKPRQHQQRSSKPNKVQQTPTSVAADDEPKSYGLMFAGIAVIVGAIVAYIVLV